MFSSRRPPQRLTSARTHRDEEKDRDDWRSDPTDRLNENAPRAWKEKRQNDKRLDEMTPRHGKLSSE